MTEKKIMLLNQMSKSCRVSVIVPMYNVSPFIKRCFDYLGNQTLTDFEVILIDDGSEDDSLAKARTLISNVHRNDIEFYLLSLDKNQGVAYARNVGLESASGEYVYFYDADDRIEPDTLSTLYEAKLKDADIVGCEWYISFTQNERYIRQKDVTSGLNLFKGFAAGVIRWNLWLFMVRRSLYCDNGFLFLPGVNMGEDMMMMMKLSLVSNRVSIVHRPLYHYEQTNCRAQTRNWSREKREQVTANVGEVEKFCKKFFGSSLDVELDFLKQAIKLPYIISDSVEDYNVWSEWFPESNKSIMRNKVIPLRTRFLQIAAAQKQYWILKLYYLLVYRFLYGVLYH